MGGVRDISRPRLIVLPRFEVDDGMILSAEMDRELVLTQRDFDSWSYGKREAGPGLDKAVSAFTDTLKEVAMQEAIQEIGLDAKGVLLEPFKRDYPIGKIKFPVQVHKNPDSPRLEVVLNRLNGFLDDILRDSGTRRRDEVVTVDGQPYIHAGYFLERCTSFRTEPEERTEEERAKRPKNIAAIERNWLNLEGGVLENDLDIKEGYIYPDVSIYGSLTPNNSERIFKLRSLASRITSFVSTFERKARKAYGPAKTTEEEAIPSFETFDDGSGARILVFFKSSPSYSDVLDAFVNPIKDKINSSCGDIIILDELCRGEESFPPSHIPARKGSLSVDTVLSDENRRLGTTTMGRKSGDRVYGVHLSRGTNYLCVNVNDLLKHLGELRSKQELKRETNLKIDYHRAPPDYLLG